MLVSIAVLLLAQQPTPVLPPSGKLPTIPPAPGGDVLVLSDGISRGAYQAGMLAAHLRGARDTQRSVRGLVGSSVGAINALLGAAEWCATPAGRESTSVLWRAWANAEWRDLLPGRESCEDYDARNPDMVARCHEGRPYAQGETLFTTNALGGVRAELLRAFTRLDHFEKGCAVRLGITLSSELPVPLGRTEAPDAGAHDAQAGPAPDCDEGGVVCTRRRKVMLDLRVSSQGRARFCAVSGAGSRVFDASLAVEPPRTRVATPAERVRTATTVDALLKSEVPALVQRYRASGGEARARLGSQIATSLFLLAEATDAPACAGEELSLRDARLHRIGELWGQLAAEHQVVPPDPRAAALQRIVALRDDLPCDEVDPAWVVDATIASVSIPFGARPRALSFCGNDCARSDADPGGVCPANLSMCTARFTQATIVDRLPLTLGLQVAGSKSAWTPSVVLLDPKRSPRVDPKMSEGVELARGSAFYRALFAYWVDTADDLEHQRLFRAGQLENVHITQPLASSPIVGEMMLGTAAYVHRRYRQHDFAAGMLDWIAWWKGAGGADVEDEEWPLEPSMEGTIAGLDIPYQERPAVDARLIELGPDALIASMIKSVLRTQARFAGQYGQGADPDRWPFGDFIDFSRDLDRALDGDALEDIGAVARGHDPVRAARLHRALEELREDRSLERPERWLANEAGRLADRLVEEDASAPATVLKLYSRLHPEYRPDDWFHVGGDSFDGSSWILGVILPEQAHTRLVLRAVTHESESELQWRWFIADLASIRLTAGPVLHFQRSAWKDDVYQLGPQLDVSYRFSKFIVPDVGLRVRPLFDLAGEAETDLDGSVFVRLFSGLVEVSFGWVLNRELPYVGLGLGRLAELTYWVGSLIAE